MASGWRYLAGATAPLGVEMLRPSRDAAARPLIASSGLPNLCNRIDHHLRQSSSFAVLIAQRSVVRYARQYSPEEILPGAVNHGSHPGIFCVGSRSGLTERLRTLRHWLQRDTGRGPRQLRFLSRISGTSRPWRILWPLSGLLYRVSVSAIRPPSRQECRPEQLRDQMPCSETIDRQWAGALRPSNVRPCPLISRKVSDFARRYAGIEAREKNS